MRKKLLFLAGIVLLAVVTFVAMRVRPTHPRETVRSPEVRRGELELREGMLYLRGAATPFTGGLVEDFAKGGRKLAIDVHAGKVDGISRGWFEDGQMEVEEHFMAGVSHGLRTRWHRNGQKKSEEHIEQGVVAGAYAEWHDNGQKAVEMTLNDEHPDGVAEAWFPDGTPKSRTRFEGGKIVKRDFFPASSTAATKPVEVTQP